MCYRVNDVIQYTTFTGGVRYVRITAWEDDVKNGRPGFDGIVVNGPEQGVTVWGYADQIDRLYLRPIQGGAR